MIVKLVRWMQRNWGPYWDSFWDQIGPYLHLVKPGHEPFLVLSEATVQPRGFWLTSKLPVSYYSNNTVFYHWPSDLETWVAWFRHVSLSEQISDVVSYKTLALATFLQSPYWCQFSLWDVLCWFITGFPDINFPWDSFHQITFSLGSLFDIVILYKPMYYDQTWNVWFFKTQEFNGRWGVSVEQIHHRFFLQGFLLGYWLYFISDTPWPWRMGYPLDFSNWRWFRQYRNFFRIFNEVNPFLLRVTFILLVLSFVCSKITNYSFWIVSFHELTFQCIALCLEFLCVSLIVLIPLARIAKILHVRIKKNSVFLVLLSDFVCTVFPWRRKRVLRIFQNVWHVFSFLLSFFLIYCLTPLWIPLIKGMLNSMVLLINLMAYGVNWAKDLFIYFFTSCVVWVWEFFGLGETILGSFLVELLKPYEYYFLSLTGYSFFMLCLIPLIFVFFVVYTIAIVWPLLKPYVLRKIILAAPWAFVEEVSLRTRVKYGIFLLQDALKKFKHK